MPTELRSLEITEISLVDRPANEDSLVTMTKSAIERRPSLEGRMLEAAIDMLAKSASGPSDAEGDADGDEAAQAQARQTFNQLAKDIASTEGCPPHIAMSRARLRHPTQFKAAFGG